MKGRVRSMIEYYSILEMANLTGIPHQTLRRYITTHKHLLKMGKSHKAYRLHKDCEPILLKIRELYGRGYNTQQVDEELVSSGMPVTIDVKDESSGEYVETPASEIFSDIKKALDEQKEFNQHLLDGMKLMSERMDAQQRFFEEALKKKDEQLEIAMQVKEEDSAPEVEQVQKSKWYMRLWGK